MLDIRDPYAKHKNSHQYWKLNLHIWEIDLNIKVLKCPLLKTYRGYTLLLHEILLNVSQLRMRLKPGDGQTFPLLGGTLCLINVQITAEDNTFLLHNVSLKCMNWHCHFSFRLFEVIAPNYADTLPLLGKRLQKRFHQDRVHVPFAENVFIKTEETYYAEI